MIEQSNVFDAVRRGYSQLSCASEEDIFDYFSAVETDSLVGHASNIKGILFEQHVADILERSGVNAELFEFTNHPGADLIVDVEGYLPLELQLKATDSVSYINQTLQQNPEFPILTTSELAAKIDSDRVLDSGISNAELENVVFESLFTQQLFDMTNVEASEMTMPDLAHQTLEVNSLPADSFVEEGLVEAVTDIAIPISPIGLVLGALGLPFA